MQHLRRTHSIGLALASLLAGCFLFGISRTMHAEELEEIKIELPEQFFGGTPVPAFGLNLEPEDYKERPPFKAPRGTVLVSRGKPVTSSFKTPIFGRLEQITDGDKHYARKSLVELGAGLQWVQIDLEREYEVFAILVWHFHEGKRVYFDVVVQLSNDPDFKEGVVTVFNNDHDNSSGLGVGEDKAYIENYQGRLIPVSGVKARYVRLYSDGNTHDDLNHYVEVEVFGRSENAAGNDRQ